MPAPAVIVDAKLPRLGYLIDSGYDGRRGVVVLYFLDPKTQEVFEWYDNTGHLPYLLTNAPASEIEEFFGRRKNYVCTEKTVKFDAILDRDVTVNKVCALDPLSIGGDDKFCFRNVLQGNKYAVWEAWIRYHDRYRYDNKINMCMPYLVTDEKIVLYKDEKIEKQIEERIEYITSKGVEYTDALRYWINLFEYPLPDIMVTSLDIEVEPEDVSRMPNPLEAIQPVISVSFKTSTGKKILLMLKRQGIVWGEGTIDADIKFFDTEKQLITEVFKYIWIYPFVVTFNGHDFDMMYLYNRANNLGIPDWFNPIYVSRKQCLIKRGVHIDLYTFFKNPSIKNYAFKGKYNDFGLDDISQALLGRGKIKFDKNAAFNKNANWLDIGNLTYKELGEYSLNDAVLTYDLVAYERNTTLNLILLLSRTANFPVVDVSFNQISHWLRSMFYNTLIRDNILVPSQEQLASKGKTVTEATIKGKKYKGAIVVDTIPGIHFDVKVVDFQSLYPSEIQKRNLGYASVRCNHKECEDNLVPGTSHWVCKKRRSIESIVVGSLKDIRVLIYKPKVKDKTLSDAERIFYSCLEQAIKVFLNAIYGVFGAESFSLYCPPVPESVAAWARYDLMAVINKAIDMKIIIIFGDTDSAGLKKPTDEQVEGLVEWAAKERDLDLGIDKSYRYAVFSSRKKNYLGVYEDGTLDIKGLTGKKRHTPPIIKAPFKKIMDILSDIKTEDEFPVAKRKIQQIVMTTYKRIKNRKWGSLDELAFHMRLGRHPNSYEGNPQHVKAARMMMERGHEMAGGDNVDFVKTITIGGVAPVMYVKDEDVNIDIYIEALNSTLAQILDPLDISFGADITGMGMTLDNFPSEAGIKRPSMLVDFNLAGFMKHE